LIRQQQRRLLGLHAIYPKAYADLAIRLLDESREFLARMMLLFAHLALGEDAEARRQTPRIAYLCHDRGTALAGS
jgi:hypothetical protein